MPPGKFVKSSRKCLTFVDSEKGSCLEIILLVLEGFLYSTRETKVNESIHFELQWIKIPDGGDQAYHQPQDS